MLAVLAAVDCCYCCMSPLRADISIIRVKLSLLIHLQIKAPVEQAEGERGCCTCQVNRCHRCFVAAGFVWASSSFLGVAALTQIHKLNGLYVQQRAGTAAFI